VADSIEIVPRDAPKAGPNSAGARRDMSQVSVTFDADAGRAETPTESRRARVSPIDLLAKHQARIEAALGAAPPPDAGNLPPSAGFAPPPPPLPTGGDEPAEAPPDAAAAPEGEPPPAEATAPEGEASEPAADPAAEAKPDEPPGYRYELEQARNEAAALRQQFEDYRRGSRKHEFEDYFDDPVAWLRSKVAEVLDTKPDEQLVGNELASLLGELTWSSVGVQDLPEAQQSQLRGERLERKTRLDQHTRQAARRATQVSQETQAARDYTRSVYEAVKDKYPAAALAEHRYGRPIQDLIVARLPQWLESGQIRGLDTKSPADLLTEAIRLFDLDSRQWAQQLSPRLASLTPVPAPATPGASSAPAAAKAPDKPQAAPKGQPDKPRTLPQKQVSAAPSRPAGAPKQDEPLSRDPEVRRRQVVERALARR
jgi:hypothetical protein